jgi:hypothetical protein
LRFRSPLLSQSRFLSLPPGTEMVHFPGFARTRLWIHRAVRRFYQRGFPHSEIPGSKPACGSPRLIAACHVLLRLLLPRHPPCALSSLTIKLTRSTASSVVGRSPLAKPLPTWTQSRRVILWASSCSSHKSWFLVSSFKVSSVFTRNSKLETRNCLRTPAGLLQALIKITAL